MKKKLLFIVLAAAVILSVISCGNKEKSAGAETSSAVAEQTQAAVNASDNKSNARNVSAQSQSNFLDVYVTSVRIDADGKSIGRWRVAKVEYAKVSLGEDSAKKYPRLAKILEDEGKKTDAESAGELKRLVDNYFEMASSIDEWDDGGDDFPPYESTSKFNVLRADKNVLSILEEYISYEGGAHPYYATGGLSYDVDSGKKLLLSDVVTDETAFTAKLKEKLLEKYSDVLLYDDLDDYFADKSFSDESDFRWSIDYGGVTVYFNPYALASFADGILTVRFSFAADGNLLNKKYAEVPNDYVMPLSTFYSTYADLYGNGEEEIMLVGTSAEDDMEMFKWGLEIRDGMSFSSAFESFSNDSYLVRKGGKFYAYMFNAFHNDASVLDIIDMASGKSLVKNDGYLDVGMYKVYGYEEGGPSWNTSSAFVNPDSFVLSSWLEVLSTYYGVKNYYVASDGKLASGDEFFRVEQMSFLILPVRDLPCKIVDKDGNVLKENAVIPKDTPLRIVRTNCETIVDFQADAFNVIEPEPDDYPSWRTDDPLDLSRGTFYRIEYEINNSYSDTFDGERVVDLFRGMMFAG